MSRRRICVDTETTGLDPQIHVPVEIAWQDLSTGESGRFVPHHDLEDADDEALAINGYHARGIDQEQQDDGTETRRLHALLAGSTLAGSNPRFDADMLAGLFGSYQLKPEPWHHRLDDLSVRAAQELALDELPGLAKVCDLLGVPAPDHSAAGDVESTAACLRALAARHAASAVKHTASSRTGRLDADHRRFGTAGAWVLWAGTQRPTWHPRAVLRIGGDA